MVRYTIINARTKKAVAQDIPEDAAIKFLRISSKTLRTKAEYGDLIRGTWWATMQEDDDAPQLKRGDKVPAGFTAETWARFRKKWNNLRRAAGVEVDEDEM